MVEVSAARKKVRGVFCSYATLRRVRFMRALNSFSLLTPSVSARKALRLMDTNNLTALWAHPPLHFASDETPDTDTLYCLQVVDHAHPVLGSISIVQMIQPFAGKAVTLKAIPRIPLC